MNDRLYKFARLVEVGSFTRAAQLLHISQPALSMAIDKLERELGIELLVRGNKRLELTPAGQAVYQAALDHQTISEQLQTTLTRIAKKRPSVTIGMIDSIATILCATAAFEQLEAQADVTVVVNNSRYLRHALEQRQLDAAFIVDDGGEHAMLSSKLFDTETLILVSSPKQAKQVQADITHGTLTRFISYDKPSTTYRHVKQVMQAHNIRVHPILFSTSPAVILDLTLRGKGAAVLPLSLVQPHITDRALVAIEAFLIERPICIAQLRNKPLPPLVQEFVRATSLP